MKNSLNKSLLKQLLNTVVPSGYEQDIVRLWTSKAKEFTKDVYVDSMGSAHAVINSKAKRKIIIAGHCDEIGLIVKSITDKGFLKIGTIGGWDPQVVVGQHVLIKTAKGIQRGVVGKQPIHNIIDIKAASKIKDLFVDIGAPDKQSAEAIVQIGDAMVLDHDYVELQNNNFASRGCDDKVGAFIALEVLRELSKEKLAVAVEFIASVQEEVGTRGIQPAAYLADADIAIAVDVSPTNDYPNAGADNELKLGKGAVIGRGPHVNAKLFELLKSTAESNSIPYQIEASGRPYGTDTEPLQRVRKGTASALLSIPCRYIHSPSETCNFDDIQAIIKLLVQTISKITTKTDFNFI